MMFPLKSINHLDFEQIPRFYGVCYLHPARACLVCAPIPLNYPIAWCRWLWIFAKHGRGCVPATPLRVLESRLARLENSVRSLREETRSGVWHR